MCEPCLPRKVTLDVCVDKLCEDKLCESKLRESKLCVDKLCVSKLCVGGGREEDVGKKMTNAIGAGTFI